MTEPILVIHVAETVGWAGGEAYLLKVASTLDRRRFRLGVVIPEDGPLVARLHALDVPTYQVPLNLRLVSVGALCALAATLRRQRPTIVQSHGARSNVYARLAGCLAGVPVVLSTVHNSLFDYEVSPLRRRLYVLTDRLTSPLAHRIVAVSHAIASDLVQRYGIPRDKVLTIWNGIDPASFVARRPRVQVLEEFGFSEHDRLIGIAARMTPQKGHEVLFRALRFLVPRFPYLRCLVIGDGPLESALRDQAATLGIAHHCVFTGARTDVADLLAAMEVAVLPSRSEGLPFFLLEAMALGRPVVATRVSGIPEVVEEGKTGLLTPPGDARGMADSLAFLLEHPGEAARMGECGRQRACEHFSLVRMTAALEELYSSSVLRST